MTDRDGPPLTSDELRVTERLRSVTPPSADPAFRERLRVDFISGSLGERPRIVPMPAARPRRWIQWVMAASAAAAIVGAVAALNQAPRWTALPSAGTGNLIVNGVSLPVRETSELTRRLRPGSRMKLESTQDLELISSGLIALQLSPGTEIVLPPAPGRWFGRASHASVSGGSLRVTTGRRFNGAHLAITTPEASVHVTGTTLAVIAEPTGTCVCVLEGTAHVSPHRGQAKRVHSGTSCEVSRGARTSRMVDMRETERPKLLDLRDRMQAVMN